MRLTLSALLAATLAFGAPALAETAAKPAHSHAHDSGEKTAAKGYFEDSAVAARQLSDWAGEWQSVYPLLKDGTLDPVWAHKAEHGDKTAAEWRDYYTTGYKSDVDRIVIAGDRVDFHRGKAVVSGTYASDGHEILTYKKGNRGVRFVFKKVSGDAAAPATIQFSDHRIAPEKADHYHLYWGDDRATVLSELTNWPTFYPATLTPAQIVTEMTAH